MNMSATMFDIENMVKSHLEDFAALRRKMDGGIGAGESGESGGVEWSSVKTEAENQIRSLSSMTNALVEAVQQLSVDNVHKPRTLQQLSETMKRKPKPTKERTNVVTTPVAKQQKQKTVSKHPKEKTLESKLIEKVPIGDVIPKQLEQLVPTNQQQQQQTSSLDDCSADSTPSHDNTVKPKPPPPPPQRNCALGIQESKNKIRNHTTSRRKKNDELHQMLNSEPSQLLFTEHDTLLPEELNDAEDDDDNDELNNILLDAGGVRKTRLDGFEEQMLNINRVWQFPVDNQQNTDEDRYTFHDHVFLDHHLVDFPQVEPVLKYMELVITGLQQNPYLSYEEKVGKIMWYKTYFSKFSVDALI